MFLPFDVIQKISEYCDLPTKINITATNKYYYKNIRVYKLSETTTKLTYPYIEEYPEISHKLTKEILIRYKYLTELNLSHNNKINDEDIQHLLNLQSLYTNKLITDKGIKGINLHTLCARGDSKITDEGIKGMNLHTLNASYNSKITNEGIKGMNLHTLYAYNNSKITNKYNNILHFNNKF